MASLFHQLPRELGTGIPACSGPRELGLSSAETSVLPKQRVSAQAVLAAVRLRGGESDDLTFLCAQASFGDRLIDRKQRLEGSRSLGKRGIKIGHHSQASFHDIECGGGL